MADDSSDSKTPDDLERIKALVELMEQHGLTEVSLRRGDETLRLRRGGHELMPLMPAPMGYPPPAPFTATAGALAPPTGPAAESRADDALLIKSPTVGTFYASPSPEDPPFVTTGSRVQHDTIVCIVEAMKVFNQIPAEVSGVIVEVLVNNGDSVEFGQPLFRVRPG